ncbi:MAG TPA: ACT domain-containing protein [Candidatus Obscuribacterales bacterium]
MSPISGKTDLATLLTSMTPVKQEGEYVFCTVQASMAQCIAFDPIGLFQEAEGLTLILPRPSADAHHLPYGTIFSMITLSVHSSLDAVGFLATITQALAREGISVNPVSAYYHDHLFVPVVQADTVLNCLHTLAQSGQ